MRAPDFWTTDNWAARLLAPLAVLYAWGGRRKRLGGDHVHATVPVICVGNIVAGGAGKTPVCIALAQLLKRRGKRVHFLTRGYGGTEVGPRLVDPVRHNAVRVGDEALLLAAHAPTWVARWRPEGAAAAVEMGAEIIIMDDGFQNGTLHQDLALVVIDGGQGFGNGRVIPAGPCREPVAEGLARASAVVLMGEDRFGIADRIGVGIADRIGAMAVLRADLVADAAAQALRGRKVVAFAGIGRPEKFFETLRQIGAHVVETHSFADHHPYGVAEIAALAEQAQAAQAQLVTTAKDFVRLPEHLRSQVEVVKVALAWRDAVGVEALLDQLP